MGDPESEQGFQVRDRRRRGDGEPPEAPPPAEPARTVTPEPAPQGTVPGPPQRSLVGLFLMLGSFAAAALEGVPDPVTGRVQADPAQAAELIDLLTLLREKTEGHRTPEESQGLDDVIYELQIRYVHAVTGAGGGKPPAGS